MVGRGGGLSCKTRFVTRNTVCKTVGYYDRIFRVFLRCGYAAAYVGGGGGKPWCCFFVFHACWSLDTELWGNCGGKKRGMRLAFLSNARLSKNGPRGFVCVVPVVTRTFATFFSRRGSVGGFGAERNTLPTDWLVGLLCCYVWTTRMLWLGLQYDVVFVAFFFFSTMSCKARRCVSSPRQHCKRTASSRACTYLHCTVRGRPDDVF